MIKIGTALRTLDSRSSWELIHSEDLEETMLFLKILSLTCFSLTFNVLENILAEE